MTSMGPMMASNGPNGPIMTSMGPINTNGAPLVMSASQHVLNGAQTPGMGYPQGQPLPPVPGPATRPTTSMSNHQPPPQLIQNGFNRNMSTDSFAYIPTATKGLDSPQLSSSGRGTDSSGRAETPQLKSSRPVTPVQQQPQQPLQPMGLPANRAKLVPGRMSNHKLDGNSSRPTGGQAGSRSRDIPST